jgi:hypothetical protein
MCVRACGFNTMVPLLILHIECAVGLTTFQTDELGLEGPIAWPPCFLDLTPLDFYLWGCRKEKFMPQKFGIATI